MYGSEFTDVNIVKGLGPAMFLYVGPCLSVSLSIKISLARSWCPTKQGFTPGILTRYVQDPIFCAVSRTIIGFLESDNLLIFVSIESGDIETIFEVFSDELDKNDDDVDDDQKYAVAVKIPVTTTIVNMGDEDENKTNEPSSSNRYVITVEARVVKDSMVEFWGSQLVAGRDYCC
mmetsp:Transcript_24920/g.59173  ORF Transcript_24920/g.59173 Transcript_24920/m.59173 type:complete len:175 (+) Transcript_24920:1653-2177(+)